MIKYFQPYFASLSAQKSFITELCFGRRKIMKLLRRLAAFLAIAMTVFSSVSCGYTMDISERVEKYLAEEYPGRTFDIIDYEKHSNTSGRYEINVRCRDDGIKFRMYIYSSIAVTDGYSVERANYCMSEVMYGEIGDELSDKIEHIEWYDIYADDAENYRFREIELKENFALKDIEKIHEIKLANGLDEAEIGEVVYDTVYELCDEYSDYCSVQSIVFTYKISRVSYTLTTDSKSILDLGKDGVVCFILENITEYSVSKEVELEYFSVYKGEAAAR